MCLFSALNSFVNNVVSVAKRTDTYHDIYKTIQGKELTLTTIITKLFRGEN
jgi:hypothetical protein